MGMPVVTPDGRTIRVPHFAMKKLRKLGFLKGNSNHLGEEILLFLNPEYATMLDGLYHLLGRDLAGPEFLVCTCEKCLPEKYAALPGTILEDDRINRLVRDIMRRRKY